MVEEKSFNLQGHSSFRDCILLWGCLPVATRYHFNKYKGFHKKYVGTKLGLSSFYDVLNQHPVQWRLSSSYLLCTQLLCLVVAIKLSAVCTWDSKYQFMKIRGFKGYQLSPYSTSACHDYNDDIEVYVTLVTLWSIIEFLEKGTCLLYHFEQPYESYCYYL